MMQTITMSAKPKDRVRVIERELESVFDPDIISHCMTILLSANATDEENTEVRIPYGWLLGVRTIDRNRNYTNFY